MLELVEEGIVDDNTPEDDPSTPIDSEELKKRIAAINRENRTQSEQKAIKMLEDKYLAKLQEYENHIKAMGKRNSYSKTDQAATFMRMKDDHMSNVQLKPAHNLQIATENQFFTHYNFFPNPTDTLTLIPFLNGFRDRYGKFPAKNVADSGYGSEENYEFMEKNQIEAYVKYNYFHKEQTNSFKNNAFHVNNLYYNSEEDYYVCPMGQHMEKIGDKTRESESGFISYQSLYKAKNCTGCPLKSLCYSAKGDRVIELNHNLNRHKEEVRRRLTSKEGLIYRSRRPVEPESVFGQTKSNKGYNRFRHFDNDKPEKVMMDFAIFAIAFNVLKLHRKEKNRGKIRPNRKKNLFFYVFSLFLLLQSQNLQNLKNPIRKN